MSHHITLQFLFDVLVNEISMSYQKVETTGQRIKSSELIHTPLDKKLLLKCLFFFCILLFSLLIGWVYCVESSNELLWLHWG